MYTLLDVHAKGEPVLVRLVDRIDDACDKLPKLDFDLLRRRTPRKASRMKDSRQLVKRCSNAQMIGCAILKFENSSKHSEETTRSFSSFQLESLEGTLPQQVFEYCSEGSERSKKV